MQKRQRYILITICTLIAVLTGGYMYTAYTHDKLWGYMPLPFLLSTWMAITLLLLPRFSKHPNNVKRYLLSGLSALLLWLGFPMMPFTPLLFVAFIPLLLVEDDIAKSRSGASKWEFFKYSFFALVLWNILCTYWVANTAFTAGLIAFLANSFLMSIPLVLYHQVKKIAPKLAWMAFVAFWLTFEYLHMRHDATWPWLNLGNAFSSFPAVVQWYEYTGALGGSLWILVGNVLLYKWLSPKLSDWFGLQKAEVQFVNKTNDTIKTGDWINLALFFVLPVAFSFYLFFTYVEKGIPKEIVVVQPNLEPHYVKFNMSNEQTMQQFLKLSTAAVSPETDYLVFPETSFDGIRTNNFAGDQHIIALQRFVNNYPKLKLVTGLGSVKVYDKGEALGPAVRTRVRGGDTLYWESHNSAIQISSGREEVDLYLKSKFVPGAEIFPYKNILFFIAPIVDQLGGSASGFASQPKRSNFEADGASVAPVICYESVFGEYCTEYVQLGAQAIFIVTNDGWWDNTAGHRQHLAFARLRAIENRRSIARSANSGISAFINQRGDVVAATRYDEPATLKGSILFNTTFTFYTWWGDMVGRIAGFVSLLLVGNTLAKSLMRKE
jgi:apolipoprotein N-acyltransferase